MTNGQKANYSIVTIARILKVNPEQLMDIKISTIEELVEKFSAKEKAVDDYNNMLKNLGLKEEKGE
jgi:uncharacterized protein YabN with tetrapyrrole methylase and pyrophosphatase domain